MRDNQRRSRARRKEYLSEVESRLRECEQKGVAASSEIQAAARKVAEENLRLRVLLVKRGVSESEINSLVGEESGNGRVSGVGSGMEGNEEQWAADQVKSDDAKILDALLAMRRPCGRPSSESSGRNNSHSCGATEAPSRPPSMLSSTPGSWNTPPMSVGGLAPTPVAIAPSLTHTPVSTHSSLSAPPPQPQPQQRLMSMGNTTMAFGEAGNLDPQLRQMQGNGSLAVPSNGMVPTSLSLQPGAQMSISSGEPSPTYGYRQQLENCKFGMPVNGYRSQPMSMQNNNMGLQPQQQPFQPSFQQPQFTPSPIEQPAYTNAVGMNSCVYATDMITAMATNAHPNDVRTDLGCSPTCVTDCEVDNRTVFAVMDDYSRIGR